MAYPGIFRTVDIFSQFQAHYSGITQEQFIYTLNLIQVESGVIRTLAYFMSLSNILFKTINLQTWNQKCFICVILGFKFDKLLP